MMRFARRGKDVQIFSPVIVLKPDVIDVCDNVRIDSFVKIEGGLGVVIGQHVHIASFAHVNVGGGRVILGEHSMVASGARILGGTNTMDGVSMSSASPPEIQVVKRLTTHIGRYSFIGANAVVMPGCNVGDLSVIGAGAVVTHPVPSMQVWAGVPARFIGPRKWVNAMAGFEV